MKALPRQPAPWQAPVSDRDATAKEIKQLNLLLAELIGGMDAGLPDRSWIKIQALINESHLYATATTRSTPGENDMDRQAHSMEALAHAVAAFVALEQGRRAVGFELKESYHQLAERYVGRVVEATDTGQMSLLGEAG